MPAQQESWIATAFLVDAEAIDRGDIACLNAEGTRYVRATAENRAAEGRRSACIALTSADLTDTAPVPIAGFEAQYVGVVPPVITGLGVGTASLIRVSDAGRLERTIEYDSADDVCGRCDADGTAYICFPIIGLKAVIGGHDSDGAAGTVQTAGASGAFVGATNVTASANELHVGSTSITPSAIAHAGSATIGGDLAVDGDGTIAQFLSVGEGLNHDDHTPDVAYFDGNVEVDGNIDVGDVYAGFVDVDYDIDVDGSVHVDEWITASEVHTDYLAVNGNAGVTGDLSVVGDVSGANLATTGDVSADDVIATGTVSANTVSASSSLTTGGSLGVTGNATVGGYLAVTGNIGGAAITASGVLAGDSLSVTHDASVSGGLTITGVVSAGALDAGPITTYGTIQAAGTIVSLSGNIVAAHALQGDTLTVFHNVDVGGLLTVIGSASCAALTCTGLTSSSHANVTGNLTVGADGYFGASPGSGGVLNVPTAAARVLVAGAKTLLGAASSAGYLFSDSSYGNATPNGYIRPSTSLSLGIGSTETVAVSATDVQLAKSTDQNWSLGPPTGYGGGLGVGAIAQATQVPYANQAGKVLLWADAADNRIKTRSDDGRIGVINVPDPGICDLVLSPRSGERIPTLDTATVSTLYLVPARSGAIALYNSSSGDWILYVTSQVSLALSGLTLNTLYNAFAYWTGSGVAFELSTSGLTTQNGVLVKSGDATRRFVGSIRATGSSSTTDVPTKRFVATMYNRYPRLLDVVDTTASWTQTNNTWRQARSSSANIVEIVAADTTFADVRVSVMAGQATNVGHARVGIGVNSTTVDSAKSGGHVIPVGGYASCHAFWSGRLGGGYQYLAWLEQGENSITTWFGDGSSPCRNAGLHGYVM